MTVGLIIGGLLILIGFILNYMDNPSTSVVDKNASYISTTGQSDAHIQRLNMDKSSEELSYILDLDSLTFPKKAILYSKDSEYKTDPDRDWIIEIQVPKGHIFKKEDLWAIFDFEWRDSFRSTVFGRDAEKKRWTYVIAGDNPETYDQLEVAVSLLGTFGGEQPDYDPEKLERYLPALQQRFEQYAVPVLLSPCETIEMAIDRARHLVHLSKDINREMLIVLEPDTPFDGLKAWDALSSLGLRWGDGDLFHWNNYQHDYGDDQFFSVWTNTTPGYFFPEAIKNGDMHPENLIFGYTIHRNADPKGVFEVMLKCAQYCQQRLGGKLLDQNGVAFKEHEARVDLHDFVQQILDEGVEPGSEKALCL